MKRINKYIGILLVTPLFFAGCISDLDLVPINPNEKTANVVFEDQSSYVSLLAGCYQRALMGNYVRSQFQMQAGATDAGVCWWGGASGNDQQPHMFTNDANSTWGCSYIYSPNMVAITTCNNFLRETTSDRLSGRGHNSMQDEVNGYRLEARFLRALLYFNMLDYYGNPPFVDETMPIGVFEPEQIKSAELFDWLEAELKNLETALPEAGTLYGKPDKGAVQMLLARMYLNAEIYKGSAKYTEAAAYAKMVIDDGAYFLADNYAELFMADNGENPNANKEIIFPVLSHGDATKGYSGAHFLIVGTVGNAMRPSDYGISDGWNGWQLTAQYTDRYISGRETGVGVQKSTIPDIVEVDTFPDDPRAMLYTIKWLDSTRFVGQTYTVFNMNNGTQGYKSTKFTNMKSDGTPGSSGSQSDTDFPIFRLAEAYLIYAECAARGAPGTDVGTAVEYINELRDRAYKDVTTLADGTAIATSDYQITTSDLDAQFVLDERARELRWELCRWTDLRRYGQLTTDTYLWNWKGGVFEGRAVSDHYNLMPIPLTEFNVNRNIQQNDGF